MVDFDIHLGLGRGYVREGRRDWGWGWVRKNCYRCLFRHKHIFFLCVCVCECVCDLCLYITLMRCTAADGMCCRLPELPLLTVSNTHRHTHARTNPCICTHMQRLQLSPLKTHLLRILPWDGTGAENVAAALLFAVRAIIANNENTMPKCNFEYLLCPWSFFNE